MAKLKTSLIEEITINQTLKNMNKLPAPEPKKYNLQEAVTKLMPAIKRAISLGYTYPQLVTILKENQINISLATLKTYIQLANKQADNKPNLSEKSDNI